MQTLLASLIAVVGIGGCVFTLVKINHLPKDTILHINFYALAAVEMYLGVIYAASVFGFIGPETMPFLVRPGVFVICTVPLVISWRMGL